MKTIMILKYLKFVILAVLFLTFDLKAGTNYGSKTVEISLPSIQCGTCKKIITKAVNKIEGVIKVSVEIDNKKAVVTFDDAITSVPEIENAISKSGYDANNVKADKEAYDKLDGCCKMPEDR